MKKLIVAPLIALMIVTFVPIFKAQALTVQEVDQVKPQLNSLFGSMNALLGTIRNRVELENQALRQVSGRLTNLTVTLNALKTASMNTTTERQEISERLNMVSSALTQLNVQVNTVIVEKNIIKNFLIQLSAGLHSITTTLAAAKG